MEYRRGRYRSARRMFVRSLTLATRNALHVDDAALAAGTIVLLFSFHILTQTNQIDDRAQLTALRSAILHVPSKQTKKRR